MRTLIAVLIWLAAYALALAIGLDGWSFFAGYMAGWCVALAFEVYAYRGLR